MNKFIRPADRWILVVSAAGAIMLGSGWHTENLWLQLGGYFIFLLTTKLIHIKYTGWRAILHLDLYLLISGLIFLFA